MDNPISPQDNSQFQDNPVNLRHYWHVLLERRWLVITSFISIFVLSVFYLLKATPIYEATARLEVTREQQNLIQKDTLSFTASQEEATYIQTVCKNLMSRSLIWDVYNDSQLKLNQQDRYRKSRDPLQKLANDISIVPIRLSRLVEVRVEHPDPRMATNICGRLIDSFLEKNASRKLASALRAVNLLRTEAQTEENKLKEAEKDVHGYAESHNQVSFEETENIVLQALKQYQSELAKARADAAAAQEIMQAAQGLMATNGITTIPQVANNPAIQAMQKDLSIAESEFADLKMRYKAKHPFYIRAEEKIASLKNSIDDRAMIIVASLRNNAQTAEATVERLQELVDGQTKKQLELQNLRIEYSDLKRKAETSELLYKTVLSKMKEMDLTSRSRVDNITVVDEPSIRLDAVKPRKMLTLILGAVGGLAIAIGLAFFVNYLDDSIKSQDDVETYLRLPFLGYVPNIKTNSVVERDLQAHLHPQSNAAEGFRTLRASISLTPKAERFRVLSVTSTIPSEGKSLVASNLAIVLAQTGLKTLLVDADLRRPSVHKAYQLHSPTGLSAFLTQETDSLDPITHKTEVPNLDVICCGSVPANPSELIGSRRMKDFLVAARGRYDRIILDSPPISAVSDPLILAAMSDGVVFVTKFNKIRREHARKSMQRLQDAGIHIVGGVLNDIDFEGKDSYYYSYYYYQNRYYASHYRSSPDKAKAKPAKEKEEELANKDRNGH